jgi:cobalt-zinc-cadmium efflux system membrane fusion protein
MGRVLRIAAGTLVAVALVGAFAVFVLQIPMPWKRAQAETRPTKPRAPAPIKLVEGQPYTVRLPESVRKSLGILQNGEDAVFIAGAPTQKRQLVMLGTTALDPARVMRIRARFAPAEVVSIAEVEDQDKPPVESMKVPKHELWPGDEVMPGMELGVFFSPDAGNKKNDLFEAIVQERLDKVILDKAEAATGVLADIYIWTARRNYDTDRSAVRRARNTLLTWGVSREDIQAVEDEARALKIEGGRREEVPDAEWAKAHEKWAKIVLKAPDFLKGPEPAVLVERNVTRGEIVVDNTVSLFTIARVDQLLIYANCPEDDVPELNRLRKAGKLEWTIQTVGTDSKDGVKGKFTEIGKLIDPNQHTAVIKGFIRNPGGRILAGQHATATVELLPSEAVVEIPSSALVEDGRQSVVFVQIDAAKQHYQMRRVAVTARFENVAWVRSRPFAPEEALTAEDLKLDLLPRQELQVNDRVLTSGVLELKAALAEMEAAARAKRK